MITFEISQLIQQQQQSNEAWREFLRVPSMSVGLYHLPIAAVDTQLPHTEDEVYYVLHGRATLQVETENHAVQPGSLVFVAAKAEHKFHSITEDLTVLVFFAPAEYSLAP